MERALKTKIDSIAWDCTVGAGNDAEKPRASDVAYLIEELGRGVNDEEMKEFKVAWQRHLQAMAQP